MPPASTHSDPGDNFEPLFQQHEERIDTETLLLGTIETTEGTIRLANALRDRRVRRALSGLGVKFQDSEDIGYSSLPFELRAHIRNIVIDDLQRDEAAHHRRRCCRRMASYACVDKEWQATIEAVTFRKIRLSNFHNELQQDLDKFVRYIVGHRRQYVQEVGMLCAQEWEPMHFEEHLQGCATYISTYSIFQLFNCIKSWGAHGYRSLTVRLEQSSIFNYWEVEQSIEDVVGELAHLPILPNVSTFYWSFPIPAEALLTLLSSFPRLRHTSMTPASIAFSEWEDKYHTNSYRQRIEFFFTSLAMTIPTLNKLEFHTQQRNPNMRCSQDDINDALMYYSQDLQSLSLRGLDRRAVINCFHPFSTERIASDATPSLSWPLLTHLYIDKLTFPLRKGSTNKLKPLIRRVGRAVRYMPRIERIIMGMEEWEPLRSLERNTLMFELNVNRGEVHRGSIAVLTVSYTKGFMTQAHDLICEGHQQLWKKSLREGANAELQVHLVNLGAG